MGLSHQAADDDDEDGRYATCVAFDLTRVTPEICLFDEIVAANTNDPDYADIIAYLSAGAFRKRSVITFSDTVWMMICCCTASTNLMHLER